MAVGGLAMAGCAGQEQAGTPAQQVSTWVSGAGAGAAIGTLDVDSKNIDLAFARHDPTDALLTVCLLLANDAQVGIGNLPSPDQQLTDDLNTAYATAYDAGMDCYNGAKGSSSLLKRSAAERAKAASQLTTAYNEITSLVGRPPSTTTTTAPVGSGMDPFGN